MKRVLCCVLLLMDGSSGIISLVDFIPLAEDIGMVEEINWIVMEKVRAFLQEHPRLPLKSISVNMAMPQLLDEKLSQKLDVFHDIGCQVIAEGIEAGEQAGMAALMGIDKIQGFYFAKPMTGEALTEFLKKSPVRLCPADAVHNPAESLI